MKRVLITGASGLLGSNLARDWAGAFDVTGVTHQHPADLPGVRMMSADLTQPGTAARLVNQVRPELVVNCAAATSIDDCERDPELAQLLNCDLAELVAAAAADAGSRLIHISTDAVFDGAQGRYREEDPPSPINAYGTSKLAGEAAVARAHPGALIVRTNLFGWNLPHKRNLAEWFLGRMADGRQCPGFSDVWFSPVLVNQLGEVLLELAETDAAGVIHAGGGTCLSKYEFGRKLAEAFGFDPELVRPNGLAAVELGAQRGQQLCLDSGRAEQLLGRAMPAVDGGMRRLRELRDRSSVELGLRSTRPTVDAADKAEVAHATDQDR